jgi:hypothetical protein
LDGGSPGSRRKIVIIILVVVVVMVMRMTNAEADKKTSAGN